RSIGRRLRLRRCGGRGGVMLLVVNDAGDDRADQQQDEHRELCPLVEALEAIERGVNDRVEGIAGRSVTSSGHGWSSIDKADKNVCPTLAPTEPEICSNRAAARRG